MFPICHSRESGNPLFSELRTFYALSHRSGPKGQPNTAQGSALGVMPLPSHTLKGQHNLYLSTLLALKRFLFKFCIVILLFTF